MAHTPMNATKLGCLRAAGRRAGEAKARSLPCLLPAAGCLLPAAAANCCRCCVGGGSGGDCCGGWLAACLLLLRSHIPNLCSISFSSSLTGKTARLT